MLPCRLFLLWWLQPWRKSAPVEHKYRDLTWPSKPEPGSPLVIVPSCGHVQHSSFRIIIYILPLRTKKTRHPKPTFSWIAVSVYRTQLGIPLTTWLAPPTTAADYKQRWVKFTIIEWKCQSVFTPPPTISPTPTNACTGWKWLRTLIFSSSGKR